MSPSLAIGLGIGGATFLLALGAMLWVGYGPVIYNAITEFGTLICG